MLISDKKVAVYSGTRNLYPMMVPAVKSLLCNSDVDEIWLYIEDDELPKSYGMPEDIVKTKNCSNQTYFRPDGPNMKSFYTYMALMRSTYALEFPELKRILSLDIDTIVVDDIQELWDLPLEPDDKNSNEFYYFSATPEPYGTQQPRFDYLYTNIGVCLYNLERLRDGKAKEVIEALNNTRYSWMEQDCFNEKCVGHVYPMGAEYNATKYTEKTDNPKIIHFAGAKNWSATVVTQQYLNMPWKEVMNYRKWRYRK